MDIRPEVIAGVVSTAIIYSFVFIMCHEILITMKVGFYSIASCILIVLGFSKLVYENWMDSINSIIKKQNENK